MADFSAANGTSRLWPGLFAFSEHYMKIHGHISIVICTFGIVTNVLNIAVLSRSHMRTPTNFILSALAVADTMTMICYVPFATHFYVLYPPTSTVPALRNTKRWMGFLLFHSNFTATTHTVSIWMGVLLAVFRYRHIQLPAKGHLTRMRRLIRARLMVAVVCLFSAIILIPNYMSYKLVVSDTNTSSQNRPYEIAALNIGTNKVSGVMQANLWIYGLLAKLVPCILMVVYGGRLLSTLNRRRVKLKQFDYLRTTTYNPMGHNRTTRMLIVVVALFLVTEFPQAVIILLSVLIPRVFDDVYMPLGDVMDVTALSNNSINFVLYCVMSTQFRKTFLRLFCRRRHHSEVTAKRLSQRQLRKLTIAST